MTDDKAEKVIQSLHGFRPLVISGDVEITHSSPIAVRLGGNLMQLRQDPFTSEIYPTSTLRLSESFTKLIVLPFQEGRRCERTFCLPCF